jgi:hypothetical protein
MLRRFVTALVIMLIASAALAQPLLNQEQVNIDIASNTTVGGVPHQRWAQVFTPSRSGFLSHLALPMACQPIATVHITIEETTGGLPSGNVIESLTVPGTIFTSIETPAIGMRLVELDRRVPVESGTSYAFTLDTTGGDCVIWLGPPGDTYSAGAGFFESAANPPGWVEIFSPARDMAFQVYTVDRWGRGRGR